MDGYFEDAGSIDYSLTHKYPFYCFTNSKEQDIFPMSAHWHYFVEILYALSGYGKVIINGYTYEFKKGDVIFVFPRDVHAITDLPGHDLEYIVIKLDPDMLFDSPKESFIFKNFRQLIAPIPASYRQIKADSLKSFDFALLGEVHDLFLHKPYRFEWLAKSHLLKFFYQFSNYLNEEGYPLLTELASGEDLTNILPAFNYIHEHYHQPITASSVADHCHLSYSYFSRQFKKITGITFTHYLNFMRITEAEKMLLDRQDSVTSIGFKVGFTDTSYFIKQFKKFKKMTPKKFVQLVRDDF